MTINILGIAGSPEKGGNTELLLDKVLEGCGCNGDKTVNRKKIVVSDLDFQPCTSCRSCTKIGKCRLNDDMQNVYSDLLWADCIVLASPVYFLGLTAQCKALIDRCQMFWARKFLLNKPIVENGQESNRRGIVLSVGGDKKDSIFCGLIMTAKAFFITIDAVYDENNSLFIGGIEEKDDVLKSPYYLNAAFDIGKRMYTG